MALLQRKGNITSKVYVLMGDGECDEGSVWEAAVSASHYKLKQLIAIIDKNRLQYDGETKNVLSMDNLEDKWRSFGWSTIVIDGHDIKKIYEAFTIEHDKPLAIIANTVKGKGISFMENNPLWHHSVLSQKQYDEAVKELEV
jgi:transketolase